MKKDTFNMAAIQATPVFMDLHMLRGSKWNLDTAGHYARPGAFELTVRKRPAPIIREEEYVD